MKIFFDTSAFVKRYVAERGSDRVFALSEQADGLIVSVICLPEMISTLSRLVREKKLARTDYVKLKAAAIADLADADICQLTSEVLTSTTALLETHPLRALDALHVACALACQPDVFASADHRQLAAARKAGLRIEDVS